MWGCGGQVWVTSASKHVEVSVGLVCTMKSIEQGEAIYSLSGVTNKEIVAV